MKTQVPPTQAFEVQTSPSEQSVLVVQQPGIEVWLHEWADASQASAVQAREASQSAAEVQQPAIWSCWHWLETQPSEVQGLLSAQSPLVRQHPVMVAFEQAPVAVSHESVVQALLSSQSAAPVQQLATGVKTQACSVVSHVSVVQVVPSEQSASAVQQPVSTE